MFGIVSRDVATGSEERIKFKSATYRSEVGEHRREIKRKKIIQARINEVNAARRGESSMSSDYTAFCVFELRHLIGTQRIFCNRKLAQFKFRKHISENKYWHKKAKEFSDHKNKNTLFFAGDGNFASNSPIRGYVRTPIRKFLKILRLYCDVLSVNEFRTTALCSLCYRNVDVSISPDRYSVCRNRVCNTVWNRDCNAARNIMYKGICQLENRDHHYAFNRNFQLIDNW